jgi:chromosome segregation ATPase
VLQDLQDSLEALDQERDDLQSQLDNELDADEKRQTLLQQHRQRIEELTAVVSQRDAQLTSLRKERDGEHRRAENGVERVRALVDENAELRRRLSLKQNEVRAEH